MPLKPADIYKSMILSNPSICKWRGHCLFYIFFAPNSPFSFSKDGHLVPDFKIDPHQKMNHDIKPYSKMLKASTLSKKEVEIRKEYEKKLYKFIENNINAIAKCPVHFDESNYGVYEKYPLDIITDKSLYFNLPENISPEWLEEVKFIGGIIQSKIYFAYCDDDCLIPTKNSHWSDEVFHDYYKKIIDIAYESNEEVTL